MLIETLNCWWLLITGCHFRLAFPRRKIKPCVYNFTIYLSVYSLHFISALTHSISLPCKMDGKEGQSVDTDFWHPVESISHQHQYSKFLMKLRIIWSNYDHNQKSTIKNQKNQGYISLHVTEINDLHCMHCISHVISCIISRHFMSHFASFHVTFHCTHHMHRTHITHIAHFAFRE